MSTCPENDIHSVYLDDELPPVYIPQYEAHLKQCAKCQATLAQLRAVRNSLRADSENLNLSQKDLDDSFARLQARLSYAKVTQNERIHRFTLPSWAAGAAAAALVAAVVLPMKARLDTKMNADEENSEVQTVAEIKPPKIPQAMIPTTHLSSLISEEPDARPSTVGFSARGNRDSLSTIQDSLASVDVFRPDFPEKAISIKITLSPGEKSQDIDIPVVIERLYQSEDGEK